MNNLVDRVQKRKPFGTCSRW